MSIIQATCVGNNWNATVSMLKQEYKEGETSLQDALDLAIKVILSEFLMLFMIGRWQ
jgi:hypothetical protein